MDEITVRAYYCSTWGDCFQDEDGRLYFDEYTTIGMLEPKYGKLDVAEYVVIAIEICDNIRSPRPLPFFPISAVLGLIGGHQ